MEMQNIVAQTADLLSVRVTEAATNNVMQSSGMKSSFKKVMSERLETNSQANEKENGTVSSTRTVSSKRQTELLKQNDNVDVKADNVSVTGVEEEISEEDVTSGIASVTNPKEEAVVEWKEEVTALICEDLDITPEEFEEIMAQLGLQVTDLQDVTNLQQLVLNVSGESDCMLFLTDENLGAKLQILVEDVTQITNVIQEEFSIVAEEFLITPEDVADEGKDVVSEVVTKVDDKAVLEPDTKVVENKLVTKEEEVPVLLKDNSAEKVEQENPQIVEEQTVSEFVEQKPVSDVVTQLPKSETVVVETEEMKPEKAESASDVKIEISVEKEIEGTTTDKKQDDQRNNTDGQKRQSVFEQFVSNLAVEKTGVTENVESKAVVVEQMKEIVNQVVEQIKVSVKADTSSMEIQLNPEHLGKVNLSVVAKEGHITAQFVTENEMARQALEGQIQQLRETLGQQGLKVDEVEVTVSNFDFAQSNQANAEEQKQQQRNGHNKRVVRNLNLNDVGSMQDLTEEEQLAARIMETNGNQVDYTA